MVNCPVDLGWIDGKMMGKIDELIYTNRVFNFLAKVFGCVVLSLPIKNKKKFIIITVKNIARKI